MSKQDNSGMVDIETSLLECSVIGAYEQDCRQNSIGQQSNMLANQKATRAHIKYSKDENVKVDAQ